MAAKVTARKFAKGFKISFDGLPMEMNGDLLQPIRTGAGKEEQFVSVSPHDTSRKLRRIYYDDVQQCEVAYDQIVKAQEMDDGTFAVLAQEEISKAKDSTLPERTLALRVYRHEDISRNLLPGEKRYVFSCEGQSMLYGIVQRLLKEHPDYVLMGKVNMGSRSKEKIMEVTSGLNGHLIVSELVWPEDLNEFDTPEWDCPDKMYETAEQLIETTIEPFDAADHVKGSRLRISALVAAASGGSVIPNVSTVGPQKTEADKLQEVLEAALAAAKSA